VEQVPWHAVLVHFPIALSVLIPLVAAILWFVARQIPDGARVWRLLPVLGGIHLVSVLVANHFGRLETARIAPLISDDALLALEAHSQAGENALAYALIVWGASMAVMHFARRSARAATWAPWAFVVLSLVVAIPILRLAQSGSELIYEHGLWEVGRR
jgi:uncharacterized membrane protein